MGLVTARALEKAARRKLDSTTNNTAASNYMDSTCIHTHTNMRTHDRTRAHTCTHATASFTRPYGAGKRFMARNDFSMVGGAANLVLAFINCFWRKRPAEEDGLQDACQCSVALSGTWPGRHWPPRHRAGTTVEQGQAHSLDTERHPMIGTDSLSYLSYPMTRLLVAIP